MISAFSARMQVEVFLPEKNRKRQIEVVWLLDGHKVILEVLKVQSLSWPFGNPPREIRIKQVKNHATYEE